MNSIELDSILGQGSNSYIYSIISHQNLVAKISKNSGNSLESQYKILERLSQSHLFPKIVPKDSYHNYLSNQFQNSSQQLILMQKLGCSLMDFLIIKNNNINIRTIKLIGKQLITIFTYLHSLNFVHNDIKPDNILFGKNQNKTKCYLIDYGLTELVSDSQKDNKPRSFKGNIQFASISKLAGQNTNILQDLESFLYNILYLLQNGTCKWNQTQVNKESNIIQKLINAKIRKQRYLFSQSTLNDQYKNAMIQNIKRIIIKMYAQKPSYHDVIVQITSIFQ